MTPSTDNPSAAVVTQADRDIAKRFISESDGDFDELAGLFARHRQASIAQHEGGRGEPVAWQHVAYFDDGKFQWMSGIKPRNCELYAHPPATRPAASVDRITQQAEEVARLKEALSDIVAEIQFPNALEAGFVHSGPTVRDMRRRVEVVQSIAIAALNEQPGGEG